MQDNSIVISAQTSNLNTIADDSCYISPIRSLASVFSGVMQYNPETREVTYNNTIDDITANNSFNSPLIEDDGTTVTVQGSNNAEKFLIKNSSNIDVLRVNTTDDIVIR